MKFNQKGAIPPKTILPTILNSVSYFFTINILLGTI